MIRNLILYPWHRLLPRSYYRVIDEDKIHCESVFVRRSLVSKENLLDDFLDIRIDALVSDKNIRDFYQWSFNLKGKFLDKDLKFKTKTTDTVPEIWDGKDFSITDFTFEYFKESIPIYFIMRDVHRLEFPLIKENNFTQPLIGTLLVKHKPTIPNYWHFQFEILDENKVPVEKGKSSWQKKTIQNFLKLHAKDIFTPTKIEHCPELSESLYYKS